ncbi:MAG: hypothetical protein ACNS60_15870 [Candidatus Cyclobacteriaceae bacterium M2_1C_046]
MENIKISAIAPGGSDDLQVLLASSLPETGVVAHNITKILALLPSESREAFFFSVVEGIPEIKISMRCRCSYLQVRSNLQSAIHHVRSNIHSYRIMMSPAWHYGKQTHNITSND